VQVPPTQRLPATQSVSAAQLVPQVLPAHKNGAQGRLLLEQFPPTQIWPCVRPFVQEAEPQAVPSGIGPQVPSARPVRTARHPWHRPVQATLQHTPSAQKPVPHSVPALQVAPGALSDTQLPLVHLPAPAAPPAQSVLALHVDGHVSWPLQTYGAQLGVPGSPLATGVQVPAFPGRSQRLQPAEQSRSQQTPSEQKREPHSSFAAQAAPFGLPQVPVGPQVFGAGQSTGSERSMAGAQTPACCATLHAWQVGQVAVSQHTPSTQCPVSQSEFSSHTPPRSSSS
jgi:hypothetical protein